MKISNISMRTLKERSIKKLYLGINYSCKSTTMLKYRDRNLDRDGINCTEAGEVRVDDGETIYDWVNIYKHNDITQPSLSKICNDYCGRKY